MKGDFFMEEKLSEKTKEMLNDIIATKIDVEELLIKSEE